MDIKDMVLPGCMRGPNDPCKGYSQLYEECTRQVRTILEQAAMIEGLREAIDKGLGRNGNIPWLREYIFEVADNTPPQALTAHDNAIRAEVAEECLSIIKNMNHIHEKGVTRKIDRENTIKAIQDMARKYKE